MIPHILSIRGYFEIPEFKMMKLRRLFRYLIFLTLFAGSLQASNPLDRLQEASRLREMDSELRRLAFQLMADGSEEKQFWALAALTRSEERSPEMENLLLTMLRSGKASKDEPRSVLLFFRPSLQGLAAWSAGYLGIQTPEVLEALKDLLYHHSEVMRSQAATALKVLGGVGIGYLEEAASSGTMTERLTALAALRGDAEGLRSERYQEMQRALFPEIFRMTYPDTTEGSLLVNGGFEEQGGHEGIPGWELILENGAKGRIEVDRTRSRNGKQSVRLVRENALGRFSIRSTTPVLLGQAKSYVLRGYFQAEKAPLNSALLFRFENDEGRGLAEELYRGHAYQSQTLLRNTFPGFWDKRLAEYKNKEKNTQVYVRIYLEGNPSEIWLDDLSFPASTYEYSYSAPVRTVSMHTRSEVAAEPTPLSADSGATNHFEIEQTRNGALLKQDGEVRSPVLYLSLRSNFGDYDAMGEYAGVPLVVSRVAITDHVDNRYPVVFPVWTASDQYDFTYALEELRIAAEATPSAGIIINLNVLWPRDWVENNPEHAWLNQEGQRGHGSTIHFAGFTEELPDGYRWWPSPYSSKALEDAADVIRAFLQEVRAGPYANRIAGCFISGGHDGQFYTASERWADYSEVGVQAFRDWLRKRYGTTEQLQQAWNRQDFDFEEVQVPDFSVKAEGESLVFLSPLHNQDVVDYREFIAAQGMIIREYFARVFKEEMGENMLAMTWQLGGGRAHASYTTFLQSDILDILVPQPSYEMRVPGYYGGISAPLAGYRYHNKLLVKELDLRTWLRAGGPEILNQRLGAAMNPADWKTINRKEIGQMVAGGHGYWYFDIGGSHFRDLDMMEEIRESREIADRMARRGLGDFKPDVAVLASELSQYWGHPSRSGRAGWLTLQSYMYQMLKTSGVPYDELYLEDVLEYEALQDYKVFVFEDAFRITDRQRKQIEDKLQRDGRTLIWLYAPGFVSDYGPSSEAVSRLTGMHVKTTPSFARTDAYWVDEQDILSHGMSGLQGMGEMFRLMYARSSGPHRLYDVQQFWIEDRNATTLARYRDGNAAIAVRRFEDWTSLYIAAPGGLEARLLHNVAKETGAYVLTEPGQAIEMNGHFISMHGMKKGHHEFKLPYRADVIDLETNHIIVRNTDHFEVSVEPQRQYWYDIRPVQ